MSNQQHPITPPEELVNKWTSAKEGWNSWYFIATQAAQWGADQELEACKQLMHDQDWFMSPTLRMSQLHNARRPKPPSLAKRALHILGTHGDLSCAEHDTIRRALEALDD